MMAGDLLPVQPDIGHLHRAFEMQINPSIAPLLRKIKLARIPAHALKIAPAARVERPKSHRMRQATHFPVLHIGRKFAVTLPIGGGALLASLDSPASLEIQDRPRAL